MADIARRLAKITYLCYGLGMINLKDLKTKLLNKVDNKIAWTIVGTLAAILIVIVLVCNTKTNKISQDVLDGEIADKTTESKEDTVKPVVTTKPVVKMSYANALNTYKDRRIQLNDACQTTPNTMTFKNGTTIMIDNRSSTTRKLNVNGAYTVGGYDYITVKLTSNTLPKTILIDCGTSQNVATILLQK